MYVIYKVYIYISCHQFLGQSLKNLEGCTAYTCGSISNQFQIAWLLKSMHKAIKCHFRGCSKFNDGSGGEKNAKLLA